MSETYSIACKDCKEHIWIAQSSYSDKQDGHIYSGSNGIMRLLYLFLIKHKGHNLIFSENGDVPIADYHEWIEEGE